MSRSTVDLQSVRFFLGYGLIFLLQSALTLALGAAAMLGLNAELALVALAPLPFVVAVAWRYGLRARPALQEVQQRIAELTADAEENISGVRVVKAFAREHHQLRRFRGSVRRVFDQSMRATRLRAFYNPFIGFLPNLGLAAILIAGRAARDRRLADAGRVHRLLHLHADADLPHAHVRRDPGDGPAGDGIRGAHLRAAGPRATDDGAGGRPDAAARRRAGGAARREPDLRGRQRAGAASTSTCDVAAGSTVALVGATASGKTSLVSLIPRLYDPSEGAVLVDGADVSRVSLTSLRAAVALVTDDPFLFSASRCTRTSPTRARRPRASRGRGGGAPRAGARASCAELPEGYDTLIGERGLTLSGGQRQRLAIARAILADPRVLILDDATSSVDASTEQQIKSALAEAMRGRTTFVIAHRLSTISMADDIVRARARAGWPRAATTSTCWRPRPLYREIVERGLPESVFLTRKPVEAEVAGL